MKNIAQLTFDRPFIRSIVTTVGARKIEFEEESKSLGLTEKEAKRMQKAIGLNTRYVALPGETIVDYCKNSALKLLESLSISPLAIEALILVTQSPNYSAPASSIRLQHLIGMPTSTLAFDMSLGCSGFVYGLANAYSFIQSGLNRVLLCVGDISTSFVDPTNKSLAPLMGDAGSAILIEASPNHNSSYFQFYSDGSGEKALYIPNSGTIKSDKDTAELSNKMIMDGSAVFTFTLKRVPSMIDSILNYSNFKKEDIDYFVLHQPNKYILSNLHKRLDIDSFRVPMKTQSIYGNQNSASIPGTINGFLSKEYTDKKLTNLFAGFGIGLSWASAIVQTSKIYAPNPLVGLD